MWMTLTRANFIPVYVSIDHACILINDGSNVRAGATPMQED